MKSKESVTKRLDLNPQVVDRAKVAHSVQKTGNPAKNLENVYFREVLDNAVDQFLPQIERRLAEIGLKRQEVGRRQRPVSIATWNRLDAVVEKFDITKIQIIRCVLELMARSQPEPESDGSSSEPPPGDGPHPNPPQK